MEVQDGFIVGVYNYCDRWCERCPLSNRCRMFATETELDFEEGNGPLTEPRVVRERRRLFAQVAEMQAQAEKLRGVTSPAPSKQIGHLPPGLEPSTGPDPEVVAHSAFIRKKVHQLEMSANPSVRLAMETIKHFSLYVPAKTARAFAQVADHGAGDQQSDANGSGKAALVGLDRMEKAWRWLIDSRHVSASIAAPFLSEIARMQRNINRALPNAGEFVRPGFDEADEVKMLNAAEC